MHPQNEVWSSSGGRRGGGQSTIEVCYASCVKLGVTAEYGAISYIRRGKRSTFAWGRQLTDTRDRIRAQDASQACEKRDPSELVFVVLAGWGHAGAMEQELGHACFNS